MQLGQPAGLLRLQAGAEQVGEQLVITPPAAYLIERLQEQAGSLDLLQQILAAIAAGDGVAERAGQPFRIEVSRRKARSCSFGRSSTSSAR